MPHVADVGAWLSALQLGQYAQLFADNHIDGAVLAQLTADDLKEIGVASLGHRKRILAALAGASEPGVPVTAPQDGDHERRQVTILFADLCGFTALSSTLDPEELQVLVARYTEAVDRIVETYGGLVDKHIGDAVMALFGAPVAHGDDPQRAARSGLEIHAAVAALGAAFGRKLEAHVGIASGAVIAGGIGRGGGQDYTVLGDSVNLAARLVALAEPGQTLISGDLHRILGGRALSDPLGEVALKGFDRPIGVWRLRQMVADADDTRSPFIGRAVELEQFKGTLAACQASGSGQSIYIRGDPGIGKTRLVAEMMALAVAAGFTAHRGLILDFGMGRGQDPIRTVMRSLLGLPPGAGETLRAEAAAGAISEGLVSIDQAAFLHDMLDLAMTPVMRSLYDAMDNSTRNHGKRGLIAALIEAVGRHRRIVIVIEDLHWADQVTLANLAALASAVPSGPVLLVMTSRREGDPLDAAWRARCADAPLTTIDLGPLRRTEALAFAGGFLDTTQRLALDCVERSGGNPLFLEQLLRNAEEGAGDSVPPSIQSLIQARMDRLPPLDRRALQVASIVGQRVELATLRHLMGEPAYLCDRLIDHALLRPDGEAFLFAHALVQEGVYASLLKARRRDLHRAAARWFGDNDPELHAQHLERAEDDAAAAAYLAAAQKQRAAFHAERALSLTARGLAIARTDADRHALTCLKAEISVDLGDVADAIALYRAALTIDSNELERCRALFGLAGALRISEGLEEALALLDLAEELAVRNDQAGELARIHHLRGNIFFPLGRIEGCAAEHERSLVFARRAASLEAEALALGGLGDAAYAQGRMRTARDNFGKCVDLSRHHGFGRIEVANRSMLGFSRFYLNEITAARDDGVATALQAARVGHLRAQMVAENIGLQACHDLGRYADASEHIAHGRWLAQRLGAHRFEAQHIEYEGRILLAQGEPDAAAATLRRAIALGRQVGLQFNGPKMLSALAMATLDAGEREVALAEAEQLLGRGAVGHNHLWFYRDAIEAMRLGADPQAMRGYAVRLQDYTRLEPLPWADLFIARGRALAATLDAAPDAAMARTLANIRVDLAASGLQPFIPALDQALGGAR